METKKGLSNNAHIEKNILPLVDKLSAISGIRTLSSCEGHLDSRGREAWVLFSCRDITLPYALWKRLGELAARRDLMLSYHWTIKPRLTLCEERPCFILEGHPVGRWVYLSKKHLLHDIDKIKELLLVPEDMKDEEHESSGSNEQRPTPTNNPSARVFSAAIGVAANGSIGRDLPATALTADELRHALIYHMTRANIRIQKRVFAVVIAPISYSLALWKLVDELRSMSLDGVFTNPGSNKLGWCEEESFFTADNEILVKFYRP